MEGDKVDAFIDQFQEQIWKDKYQYNGETFEGFCNRISNNVFSKDNEKYYKEELYKALINFKVLFGGRINANIGISEEGLTLFNCFILPTVKDPDSLEGIMDMARNYVMTLKTEGGAGFCADFFRPSRTLIRKIGVATPGSIKFLEIFDKLSEVITSGSVNKENSFQGTPTKNSIRKGATMVTMSICHPDIEEFITAKSVPNRLTKMNMTVLISDAFIKAVENNSTWDLWFPDINFDKYESEWRGDFSSWKSKGYPIVVYKTVEAIDLWNLLIKSSYMRNEPGVMFIDNARTMDNLWYLPDCVMNSCNPCVIGSTRLHTDQGMIRTKDLYDQGCENKVVVDNRTIDDKKGVSILNATPVIKTGENMDVYKVVTKAGYEISATNYHRFFTIEGKKELKDLMVGDKLFIQSAEGGFGSLGNINLGRIVGMIAGDGTIYHGWDKRNRHASHKAILRLWGKDKELSDYFISEINNLIKDYEIRGHKYTVSSDYDEKADRISIDSSVLYRVLSENGLSDDIKHSVPDYIFNGSRECIVGYLQGLFQADGCVNYNNKSCTCSARLSSISISLLKDVQILLSNFGILSRIHKRSSGGYRYMPDGSDGSKPYFCKSNYELIIDGSNRDVFMKKIGFMLDYKNSVYTTWVDGKKLLKKEKFIDEIVEISYVGKEDVYCLTQPDYQSVIFNGIVTGNCSEVLANVGIVMYNNTPTLVGDVCNLGSINITNFYDPTQQKFDIDDFNNCVKLLVRSLDNISDISNYPLPLYEQAAKLKRKVGVGITGIGSLAMMMNMRYGSDPHIKFLELVGENFINAAYQASALLAKEKGSFPLYDKVMLDGGFIKHSGVLTEETVDLIKEHGLRNAALSAVAPNGTLSILAGNVSGGIEPVFSKEFTRWNRVEGKTFTFKYPDIHKSEWFETDYFKEQKVGDEIALFSTDGQYRIDKNNGLCRKVIIKDYGYNIAKALGYTETSGAMELSVEEHLKVLSTIVRYIDMSTSKTINLPNDIKFEEFSTLYRDIHKYGIKGCTTYREGTSVAILETANADNKKSIKQQQKEFLDAFKEQKDKNIIFNNVKLPDEYPARGFIIRSENKKWYLHVAFKDKACTKPFAIFVNTNSPEGDILTFTALDKLSILSKTEGLNGELLEEVKRKYAYQKNPVKICRMLGFLLRHNVSIYKIIAALDNVEDAIPGTFVHRIKKFLSQFVEDYVTDIKCPMCGESIIFQEGCFMCHCGYSKCG
ncbi:MAG: LAGLIDADG family homing endonuclease [Dehalococcoidia bacterium]